MAMNWSYFKSEFSGKPEEDPKAHLLRSIDWMDMHKVAADQIKKVKLDYATNQYIHFKVIGNKYGRV